MARYTYRFRKSRTADLTAAGYECMRCAQPDRPMSVYYSQLERGHLDGDRRNDAPENIEVLCRRCHRAHDIEAWRTARRAWLAAERERKIDEADAARPILQFLREGAA